MSKTKFAIGVVIEAIDKVTAPARGITAALKKMSAAGEASEKALAAASGRRRKAEAEGHKSAARREGGAIGRAAQGLGAIGAMIPQIAAVAVGVGSVVEGYNRVTKASDEALAASQKLELVMLKVKGATRADVDAIMDLSGELQKTTAYGDELFMGAASALSTFGMKGNQVKAILPALADYLALTKGVNATEEDGEAAAKLLGKAWSGNVNALKKQGIVLNSAQAAILKVGTKAQKTAVLIRAIESRAGGLAKKQATGTPEGMKKVWDNALGEIEEKAGLALKPLREGSIKLAYQALPYLEKFADALLKVFSKGWSWIQGGWSKVLASITKGFAGADVGGFMKSIRPWGPRLQKIFKPMLPLIDSVMKKLGEIIGKFGKWWITAWNRSQPGLKAFAEGISPIIDALKNLWHRVLVPLWDYVLSPFVGWLMETVVPFLWNKLGPAFRDSTKAVAESIDQIIGFYEGLYKWSEKGGFSLAIWYTNLWANSHKAWNTFKSNVTSAWKDLFGGIFKWIEEKWQRFLDPILKVANFLGVGSGLAAASSGSGASGGGSGRSARGAFTPAPLPGQLRLDSYLDRPVLIDPTAGREKGGKLEVTVKAEPGLKVKVKTRDDIFDLIKLGPVQGIR
jgi:hypothetical protein